MGSTGFPAVRAGVQWLRISELLWVLMCQLVPVGTRSILGIYSCMPQLLSSLLRSLQISSTSRGENNRERLQSFMPVAFKAIVEQHLRLHEVRTTSDA